MYILDSLFTDETVDNRRGSSSGMLWYTAETTTSNFAPLRHYIGSSRPETYSCCRVYISREFHTRTYISK